MGEQCFCLIHSSNSFIKLHFQFLTKLYQIYSLCLLNQLCENNFNVLFDPFQIVTNILGPLVQEYLDVKIPLNMKDTKLELHL